MEKRVSPALAAPAAWHAYLNHSTIVIDCRSRSASPSRSSRRRDRDRKEKKRKKVKARLLLSPSISPYPPPPIGSEQSHSWRPSCLVHWVRGWAGLLSHSHTANLFDKLTSITTLAHTVFLPFTRTAHTFAIVTSITALACKAFPLAHTLLAALSIGRPHFHSLIPTHISHLRLLHTTRSPSRAVRTSGGAPPVQKTSSSCRFLFRAYTCGPHPLTNSRPHFALALMYRIRSPSRAALTSGGAPPVERARGPGTKRSRERRTRLRGAASSRTGKCANTPPLARVTTTAVGLRRAGTCSRCWGMTARQSGHGRASRAKVCICKPDSWGCQDVHALATCKVEKREARLLYSTLYRTMNLRQLLRFWRGSDASASCSVKRFATSITRKVD